MRKNTIKILFVPVLILLSLIAWAAETNPKDLAKLFIDTDQGLVTNTKQLTFVGSRSGEGYFSKDGTKMIYQSERESSNPFYQMYLLDFKTGETSRLTSGKGMTTCGWVHPNLKKVMWSSTHLDKKFGEKVKAEFEERAKPVKKRYSWSYDDQYDIFESDLKGKNVKRLTNSLGYDAEGSYSPNGKYIAFASNRSQYSNEYSADEKKIIEHDSSYAMEIYIMNSDGTNVKRLTQSKGYDGGPFFSADGSKITWRRFSADGSRAEIYSMNIDGREQKQITKLNAMSWAPYFHPSGKYIIFTSSILGYSNFELFIVDAEGNGLPVRVTFNEIFDGLPVFSPDGKKLSWTKRNEKGESQIYIADWNHESSLKLISEQSVKALTETSKKLDPEVKATSSPSGLDSLSSDIKIEDTKAIVQYLASEKLQGRMTGSAEEIIYTNEIAKLFKKWNLKPAFKNNEFIQSFEFTSGVEATEKNKVDLKGRYNANLKRGEDYQVLSFSKSDEFSPAPMIFAGYGIKTSATEKHAAFNSYNDIDVKGKWVVLFYGAPNLEDRGARQHLLTYAGTQHKMAVAKNLGALGVVFLADTGFSSVKFEGALAENTLAAVKLKTDVFGKMLQKNDGAYTSYQKLYDDFSSQKSNQGFDLKSQYISATVELKQSKALGHNVVGYLEPVKNKKAKAILVGAHGDHLGASGNASSSLARADEKTLIHYGADDNASGVSGVLELAQYYSSHPEELKKPIYFAIWSGEEIGVLGSNHFTKSWNKKFNDSFLASLNMDMIGRFKDKLLIQGLGSSTGWSNLVEKASVQADIPLATTNDPYLPTDAMSFYLAEIPSISFFTGTHEEYHTPRDTFDKLNYEGLVKTIKVVKSFIDQLGQADLKYQKVEGNSSQKLEGRSFRVFLGTIPDYSQESVKGVKISGASKNSPAEKAGLLAGDIIVSFDGIQIENIYDYVFILQSIKPNVKTSIEVLRSGEKKKLEITPLLKD